MTVVRSRRAVTRRKAQLLAHHREELARGSAISADVIDGRGYHSVLRSATDLRHQTMLKNNRISKGIWNEPSRCPGILLPLYTVLGERRAAMYKPDNPRSNEKGKPRKYEAPFGVPAVLDVHPCNVDRVADLDVDLWVTEGVKKGDALTSAGECAISLAGVWNWRNADGPLGDWEHVPLRGRKVHVCFDSDVVTKPQVAGAAKRLAQYLRSKGSKVDFVIPPAIDGDPGKVGVDDYLAAGGTIGALLAGATMRLPRADFAPGITEAVMAERIAEEDFQDVFRFAAALGWLRYDGVRWIEVADEVVIEAVRVFILDVAREALEERADSTLLRSLTGFQRKTALTNLAALVKGIDGIWTEGDAFDRDPFLLNCTNGVVDLRTLELLPHAPELLMRHCTGVDYNEDAVAVDWTTALQAVPDGDTQDYLRSFFGTGALGLASDDVTCVLVGQGANGKSTVIAAVAASLGSYSRLLPVSMLGGGSDHASDGMQLLGTRLAYLEETGPDQRLDTVKLKRLVGTPMIRARALYRAAIEFRASHTLILATNHPPVVTDTDEGTWRRLVLVPFKQSFAGAERDKGLRDRLVREQ